VSGPGDFDVTVDSTTVTFTNFTEDFGSLSSVLSVFGYTVSDLGIDVEGLVEDELVAAIEDTVPGALEDALEAVSISETLAILDAEATLSADVTELSTTTDGLTLMMTAAVSNDGTHEDIPDHPGSLILGGDAPEYDTEPGLFLGLSLDALNPQIAARLTGTLNHWRRYDAARQDLMKGELERIVATPHLSRDVYEIASKALA